MKNWFKRGFAAMLILTMAFALAACGGDKDPATSGGSNSAPGAAQQAPADNQDTSGATQTDGWYSSARLSSCGLSGLQQPTGTTVRESSDTNVKLTGMTGENYKAWVADAFALISENHGGVYEAKLDDSFKVGSFAKIPALTAADVSTDELPSFDLIYKYDGKTYSLYILFYPVDYLGESAGYAEVRLIDMSSEWGSLPFNE